jgi:hypothetical protein
LNFTRKLKQSNACRNQVFKSGNKPVLINIDHVRTAFESGSGQVKLVMGSGAGGEDYQEVDGDLKSVWEKLEPPVPPIEE